MPLERSLSDPEILSPVPLSKKHVVIVGGGFAGWYAARHLAGILPMESQITLVDRVNHMLYTPMLTEVAGGGVAPENIAVPAAKLPRRVRFIESEVRSINASEKTVELVSGGVLRATELVLALGATTAYHDVPGARDNSFPLKTLADANEIRERLDGLVASAARGGGEPVGPLVAAAVRGGGEPVEPLVASVASGGGDPVGPAVAEATRGGGEPVALVVAGGGYTGVESVAALRERMLEQARRYGLPEDRVSATVVEPLERLMQEIPAPLAQYSHKQLELGGVRVLLGVKVTSVESGSVELSSGERLPASLLVWDTGIEPSPLLKEVDVPKGKHHGVVVDAMFRVKDRPGVWAIGDCAEVPQPDGGTYAATAQNASREGVQVARNIVAVMKGRRLRPFRYRMLGQLALLARRDAVAEILGVQLRGFLTWVLWWGIYIAKLPDNSRRLAVLLGLMGSRKPSAVDGLLTKGSSLPLGTAPE